MNKAATLLFIVVLIFSENAFGWDAKTLYMYFHEVKPTPYDGRFYELWIDAWSNSDPEEAFRMHCKALEPTKDGAEIRSIYKRK